uniref:Knottin scorpion toxin-like domain-containing protein n=1 Tax=Hordeum vulgare subsp. vulgare TaxID=112509 RepID=A0A8I6WKB2_HORVV
MGARNTTICLVLILVLFANLGSAEKCWESTSGSPLCIGFLCKATCFIAGKMFNSVVKEHRCMGSAFNSQCYCYLCDK